MQTATTQSPELRTQPPKKGAPAMQAIRHFTLALALLALSAVSASAATYTWTAGGADTSIGNADNWDTGDPAVFLKGGADTDLVFGTDGTSVNTSFVNHPNPMNVNSITFTRPITMGTAGTQQTVRNGVTITSDVTTGPVSMSFEWALNNYDNTLKNNSNQDFSKGVLNGSRTLTNSGSGTGWVRFSIFAPNLVQDSLTSHVSIETWQGSIAGNLTIKRGLVTWQDPRKLPAGSTRTITLGYTDALATDWGALGMGAFLEGSSGNNAVLTIPSPIVMAGTQGTYTIRSGRYSGSSGHIDNWTGGVTGTNSLYLDNVDELQFAADAHIQFSTGSINMGGALIHVGAGNGTAIIDSVIGANVTEVIQNSASSKLILGNANLHGGNTTVQAGTLELNNVDALQNSTLDTGASGSQQVTFAASGTYNIGGLTGSDDLAIGGNTISVGANDQTTSYSGNITGTGGLTKVGDGVLTLTGSGNSVATTSVTGGTLVVNGSLTSAVTVGASGTLKGSGTITGDTIIQGTHAPGSSPGIQPVVGNLTYSGGSSTVVWELTKNSATQENPAIFDQVTVTGDLDFAAATALILDFTTDPASAVDWTNSFWGTSHLGTDGWLLYTVGGTTTGFGNLTISGLDWQDADGDWLLTLQPKGQFLTYFDEATQNVYLNYALIPEPASVVLLGLAGLVLLRRRR